MSQQRRNQKYFNRSTLWSLVGYFIVILGLVLAVTFVIRDFRNLDTKSLEFNFFRILLSFFVSLLSMFFAVLIWRSILRTNGINNYFKDDLRIYIYSLLGYMLPGGVWTIFARGFLSESEDTIKKPLILMAGVVETILTGIAALFLCILVLYFQDWSFSLPLAIPLGTGIIMMVVLSPKIFNRVSLFFLRMANKNNSNINFQYTYCNLLVWFLGEIFVIFMGSVALVVLLSSFLDVNLQVFVLMMISWSFAVAISSLFFWLPGTPFVRDGTMVGILSTEMRAGFAVIFVIVQRLWSILTILMLSVFLWLLFDLPTIGSKIKN